MPQAESGYRVTRSSPPDLTAGMTLVVLDTKGRLKRLNVQVPQIEAPSPSQAPEPDWTAVLTEAGLEHSSLSRAASTWTPSEWADVRVAWTGTYPDLPDVPLRIEAAGYRGRVVSFHVIAPWTQPWRTKRPAPTPQQQAASWVTVLFFVLGMGGGLVLARRNQKLGRTDMSGAQKLAGFVLALSLATWALQTSHVPTQDEFVLANMGIGGALFNAVFIGILYLAIEPPVRRGWPWVLIAWSRLLAGRASDPLVGRDVLIGSLAGTGLALFGTTQWFIESALGGVPPYPLTPVLFFLHGQAAILGGLASQLASATVTSLAIFLLFFFLRNRLLLRRDALAAAAVVVLFTFRNVVGSDYPIIDGATTALAMGFVMWVLIRFGLVAFAVTTLVNNIASLFPFTAELGKWYGGPTIIGVLSIAGLTAYGWWASRQGQFANSQPLDAV